MKITKAEAAQQLADMFKAGLLKRVYNKEKRAYEYWMDEDTAEELGVPGATKHATAKEVSDKE